MEVYNRIWCSPEHWRVLPYCHTSRCARCSRSCLRCNRTIVRRTEGRSDLERSEEVAAASLVEEVIQEVQLPIVQQMKADVSPSPLTVPRMACSPRRQRLMQQPFPSGVLQRQWLMQQRLPSETDLLQRRLRRCLPSGSALLRRLRPKPFHPASPGAARNQPVSKDWQPARLMLPMPALVSWNPTGQSC